MALPKNNKWSQPANPPPPLFVGKAERNFVKQINDEIIEKIIGEQLRTQTHLRTAFVRALELDHRAQF